MTDAKNGRSLSEKVGSLVDICEKDWSFGERPKIRDQKIDTLCIPWYVSAPSSSKEGVADWGGGKIQLWNQCVGLFMIYLSSSFEGKWGRGNGSVWECRKDKCVNDNKNAASQLQYTTSKKLLSFLIGSYCFSYFYEFLRVHKIYSLTKNWPSVIHLKRKKWSWEV